MFNSLSRYRRCWLYVGIALTLFAATQTSDAAFRHREMKRARYALENALKALVKAEGKFGGHRQKAIELTEQALTEVKEGLKDDKGWY